MVLHFQLAPRGRVTSPQVPEGALRELARSRGLAAPASLSRGALRLTELKVLIGETSLLEEAARERPPPTRPEPRRPVDLAPEPSSQKFKNVQEFQARRQTSTQANAQTREPAAVPPAADEAEGNIEESAFAPLWSKGALLLVRRVRVDGATYIQGCWLDWPTLEKELLGSIRDLLPDARLEPVDPARSGTPDEERRLATLPVRLLPGAPEAPSEARRSPVRLSLVGAWVGLLLGAFSVAALLQGVMALSERRREFVSAVSHELRTPLTTFRLYADMLAGGMVAGEEKRQEYLARLRLEAQRLSHLVENVLFYSRLESGRSGAVRESINLSVFLKERVRPLAERAERAALTLVVDDATDGRAEVRADGSALEQILQNLVDNSCKYAARSEPSTHRPPARAKGEPRPLACARPRPWALRDGPPPALPAFLEVGPRGCAQRSRGRPRARLEPAPRPRPGRGPAPGRHGHVGRRFRGGASSDHGRRVATSLGCPVRVGCWHHRCSSTPTKTVAFFQLSP